jgi:hypothetical protein
MGWLVVGVLASMGCNNAPPDLTIVGAVAVSGATCDPASGTAESEGVYDIAQGAATPPYVLSLHLINANNEGGYVAPVNKNDIQISGATSQLLDPSGQSLGTLSVPLGGPVIQEGGATAGVSFGVMDSSTVAKLQAGTTVIAKVDVTGNYLGGGQTSAHIDFPIRVCSGCLQIDQGACTNAVIVSGGTGGSAGSMPAPSGDPCNPAEDVLVDCCHQGVMSDGMCTAGPLLCPSPQSAGACVP